MTSNWQLLLPFHTVFFKDFESCLIQTSCAVVFKEHYYGEISNNFKKNL